MLENTFIYLIGFPGTGKYTIALELQKLIPSILVDNHLINNVVFSLIDPDGRTPLPPKVWENTWAVRKIVLNTIENLSRPGRNFIFTNALEEDASDDIRLFREIEELAKVRGATLHTFRLLISADELAIRVTSSDRVARFKATDAESAREQVLKRKVFLPSDCSTLSLDVTSLSPMEAAKQIYAEVRRVKGV